MVMLMDLLSSKVFPVKEVAYEDIKDEVFQIVPEPDYAGIYNQVMNFYSYGILNEDGSPVYNALRTIRALKESDIPFIFTIDRLNTPGLLKITFLRNLRSIQEIPVYKLKLSNLDENEEKGNTYPKKEVLRYLFTNPKLDAKSSVTVSDELLDQLLNILYSGPVKISDLESTRDAIWNSINSAYLETISNRIR